MTTRPSSDRFATIPWGAGWQLINRLSDLLDADTATWLATGASPEEFADWIKHAEQLKAKNGPCWLNPISLTIADTWTYLSEGLRIRRCHHDYYRFEVQVFRNCGWNTLGTYAAGSTQRLNDHVRVHFKTEVYENAATPAPETVMDVWYQGELKPSDQQADLFKFKLDTDWAHVLPGLQVKYLTFGTEEVNLLARVWRRDPDYINVPVGSKTHGDWGGATRAASGNAWITTLPGYHLRLSRSLPKVVEIRRVPNFE